MASKLRRANLKLDAENQWSSVRALEITGTSQQSPHFRGARAAGEGASVGALQLDNQRLRAELDAVRQAMHGGVTGGFAATAGLQAELERLRVENSRLAAGGGDGQNVYIISLGMPNCQCSACQNL
jgi:hypothetical protein